MKRDRFLRALGASTLAIALVGAADASAQAPAAKPPAGLTITTAVKPAAVPAPVVAPVPPVPHRRRHVTRTSGSIRTVERANSASRSRPTAGAYVNATLYYDYEPGRLYAVNTSPRFLTAITLRPGEKLISKAAGDTVRWVLGETVQGVGATEQVIVVVKPIRGDLRTNIVLTTDQRTYLIEAVSREGDTYTSAVSWNYPQEQMRTLAQEQAAQAQTTVAAGLSIDQLHFGYKVRTINGKPPRWQPLRVFDDGLKTYIQFPVNMAATDAPPLFLVGPGGQAQLVNYRYANGYYVVDRLVDTAELRLGEKPQLVVRITRTGEKGQP